MASWSCCIWLATAGNGAQNARLFAIWRPIMGVQIALDKWIHQKMQKFIFPAVFLCFSLLTACRGGFVTPPPARGEAVLQAVAGSGVGGTVSLVPVGDKLRLVAEVSGLQPGAHAFFLRAGDCLGELQAGEVLALPVLIADSAGKARLAAYVAELTAPAAAGRKVVVHALPGGLAGPAGAPVACGSVGLK